jgi:hypothetical protein
MTALAWRPQWQSLLANGTVNNPELNNLTGIVYGAQIYTLLLRAMHRTNGRGLQATTTLLRPVTISSFWESRPATEA